MKKRLFHIKKKDFQKGAISAFLVIILVPCIVMSSMFVDLSRVKLAKGVGVSAADLALNSLMANYDKDLSEYYGLMASCQNIEEFYDTAAMCFLDALYSQGLNADESESLLTYVNSLFNDDTVHDLFQMEVQTETSEIVGDYKDASLGDSSVIIKDQIVEFMKYRGPIEITTKVIDRLKSMDAGNVLGDAEGDEKLVEDKKAYADAEEDFMDSAYKTYKLVLKYEEEKVTVDTLKGMLDDMKKARETYREIVKLMVSNLNGTSELKQFTRPTFALNYYSYNKGDVYSRREKNESNQWVYYIDKSKIKRLLNDLDEEIEDFKAARRAVETAVGGTLIDASIGSGNSQYNPIQWWKAVDEKINGGSNSPIGKYKTAAKNMLKAYAKVIAIEKCELDEDVPENWKESIKSNINSRSFNQLTQSAKDLRNDFLKAGVGSVNSSNKYLKLVNKLEKFSGENINNIKPDSVYLSDGRTVSTAITDVKNTLKGHVDKLNTVIGRLNEIINGKTFVAVSLDTLGEKASTYNSTYNTWRSGASVNTTQLEKSDWESIQEIESKAKDGNGALLSTNKTDILAFKSRLISIRDRLISIRDTIESMKFGDKKLTSIGSYNTAYNKVKNDIGENLKNSQITNKANELFRSKFTPYSSDKNAAVKSYNFSENTYNPDLTKSSPEFYKWMNKKFEDKTVEDLDAEIENKKQEKEDSEGEGDNKSNEAKDKDRSSGVSKTNLYGNSSYTGSEFPSELDGNGKFPLGSSFIKTLAGAVSSLVNMEFSGMRDSLYATEYVMDMFSYATYENEGLYNLYKDNNNGNAPKTTDAYNTVRDEWKTDDITKKYNQTLTNKKINAENNVLYGAEAEYILYGKTNSENLKSAYGDIFTIRFLLNTLSGFLNFWTAGKNITATTIDAVALGISGATCGVVPVPVIKVVAIMLLTAFETAKDLDRLQNGFPVELYKKDDTQWNFTLTGLTTPDDKPGTACDDGLFYSDYIYLFLYMGFENSTSASEMYRRTADLIQVNLRKYTGKSSYSLKNSRSYFELNATIRVNPLMLALPYALQYDNNPKDSNDWCTFKVHEIRGYS